MLLTATRELLDQLLMQATDYAAAATNEGRKQLSLVGLPASLETYKSGGEFPDNLWMSVQRVQSFGGASELTERLTDLEGAAQRAARSIEGIDASIAREERIDLGFRARFPSSTKTTPSTVLNGDMKVRAFSPLTAVYRAIGFQ